MSHTQTILQSLPGNPYLGLQRADTLWHNYRHGKIPVPDVVSTQSEPLELPADPYDVVICGGTLGIMLGATLASRGWRVALLERNILKGREQEWNISRSELRTFVDLGLLSEVQLETAIATEYNPARIYFEGGEDLWVRDVLNVGVDPVYLLETLKQVFLAAGGELMEKTPFSSARVAANGVQVTAGEKTLTTRLLIDTMGHFSPIVQQARQGHPPDAVCLVVGTCATGYQNNQTGDLIASFTPIKHQCQYFWEAFPARDGRTTYLFTYLDAHPDRITLRDLFEDYFQLLPDYQGVPLEQLQFKRALFGFFPAYRNSPLRFPWNRLLAVGDASGHQSPLSFGGFGAMIRHLGRLSEGIDDALRQDQLNASALSWLQPYQPNIAVTWLFQKAMSLEVDQSLDQDQINTLLTTIFQDMAALGDPVLRPFLQDVVQFLPLAKTLLRTSIYHPLLVAKILPQVGIPAVLDWTGHYLSLAVYSALNQLLAATPSQSTSYYWRRWRESLIYGSGSDHNTHSAKS
ncbi:fad dependent oxidoreductase [Leptolyngbya sp. Heron Island J]|uniref:FAD-dependent oxidoreductase n=1 Tax=Leptolyngbya sp. Heron Island J TaxID=1385935 RepID=UPI0003B9DE29|nr:FAD-dependent oxidoreductase [Leptolyngbya sp. Heron Island J]ESA37074.1 fad dependent oxidoreductase [Leptolyngbya sp. Heron Island J]